MQASTPGVNSESTTVYGRESAALLPTNGKESSGSSMQTTVRDVPTTPGRGLNDQSVTSVPSRLTPGLEVMTEKERVIELNRTIPLGCQVHPHSLNSRNAGRPNFVSTTKFTPLTWLPKSLFYQFQRVANIYFLFIAAIVCMGSGPEPPFDYTPKKWHSKVFPFLGVLLWTALKDLYEDSRRRRDDEKENTRLACRYNHLEKKWTEVMWKDVRCGDVLLVRCDQAFPADLILLHAAGGHEAYISTANLDGETSLKERRSPPAVNGDELASQKDGESPRASSRRSFSSKGESAKEARDAESFLQKIMRARTEMRMSAPQAGLADISATVKVGNENCAISEVNFLPRGCVLRNTQYIVALAAYVGEDTKTRLNMTKATTKTSNMQMYLNMCVWGLLVVLFVFCCYCATLAGFIAEGDEEYRKYGGFAYWIIKWLTFCITFYHVVPISLYVVFEMLKLLLGVNVNADEQMNYPSQADPTVMEGAVARTADLIEEMGQVDFLFSDKTGTLTANEMVFARCSVVDTDFGDFRPTVEGASGVARVSELLKDKGHPHHARVHWFFECLAVCHAVQVERAREEEQKDQLLYSGQSPDEVSLVQAAHNVGVVFTQRLRDPSKAGNDVHLNCPDGSKMYSVLYELPFNSDRKRMSTIVRDESDRLWCITKGADAVLKGLIDVPLSDTSEIHLNQFSKLGLRTLLIASKKVDEAYFKIWEQGFKQASCLLGSTKDAKIARLCAEMETHLQFVGITAVEDKLQDGVPETIATLKQAGIRVWVLTGDKTETAVDIARSCNLFQNNTTLAYCTEAAHHGDMLDKMEAAQTKLNGCSDGGLVLDGKTVTLALESPQARRLIYELGLSTRTCLCCRLSPMQKRKLVELVRAASPSTITLAIGDGANDVPMIDGAHVGVGIRGKEGTQAVQASDVAISQFRFLQPLLLCHGRRGYRRVAFFLCYYLYKNVALAMADVVWAHVSKFSGQIAYPEYLAIGFNVFFTSVHVVPALGYDIDVEDKVSLAHPELYLVGTRRALFNGRVFARWILYALWHGSVVWLVPNLTYAGQTYHSPAHMLHGANLDEEAACALDTQTSVGTFCCSSNSLPDFDLCSGSIGLWTSISTQCKDFVAAAEYCQGVGARLCTAEEASKCLPPQVIGCDMAATWLQDKCEARTRDDPNATKFWIGSCAAFLLLISVVLLRLMVFAESPTQWTTWAPSLASFLFFFPYVLCLGYTPMGIAMQPNLEQLPFKMFTEGGALLSLVVTPCIALFPDVLERVLKYHVRPTDLQKVRANAAATKAAE